MTTLWGTLETNLDLAISKLAGYEKILDSRALILLAHSNFQQRVDILSSLCEWLLPSYPNLVEYKEVVKKINSAQKSRNKYAHNSVTIDEDSGKVFTTYYSARGELKTNTEIVHLADIQEATAKIHESMCALHTLITGKEMKPIWERT